MQTARARLTIIGLSAAFAALALAICAGAQAALPQQSGGVDLLTQANLTIGGAAADLAGISVAAAGDVNGDGRADVIIGAPVAGNNGRDGSGSAYVIFGRESQGEVDLTALGAAGFRIDGGADDDSAGGSVAHAGDVERRRVRRCHRRGATGGRQRSSELGLGLRHLRWTGLRERRPGSTGLGRFPHRWSGRRRPGWGAGRRRRRRQRRRPRRPDRGCSDRRRQRRQRGQRLRHLRPGRHIACRSGRPRPSGVPHRRRGAGGPGRQLGRRRRRRGRRRTRRPDRRSVRRRRQRRLGLRGLRPGRFRRHRPGGARPRGRPDGGRGLLRPCGDLGRRNRRRQRGRTGRRDRGRRPRRRPRPRRTQAPPTWSTARPRGATSI